MSFKFNHNNPPISLENYEEYLLLYVDGELSHEQMAAVDAFLEQHPHLQAELELLLSTRLPSESISFDKEILMAHRMPAGSIQEDLLLYVDNELSPEKEKEVQFELASNPHYQLQHKLLSTTKLDASEIVPHPNRAELYRSERRVVPFRIWMRVAAVVAVVVSSGVALLMNNSNNSVDPSSGIVVTKNAVQKSGQSIATVTEENHGPKVEETTAIEPLASPTNKTQKKQVRSVAATIIPGKEKDQEQTLALANEVATAPLTTKRATAIETSINTVATAFSTTASVTEKNIVTSETISSLNNQTASVDTKETEVANHKGSLKSFFRKATRVIGRTTGISSEEDDDGKVLIGAMAVKLK